MLLYISIGKLTQYKADLVAYNGGDVCVVDDFDFTPFDCDTYMRQSCGIPSSSSSSEKENLRDRSRVSFHSFIRPYVIYDDVTYILNVTTHNPFNFIAYQFFGNEQQPTSLSKI